MWVWTKHTYTTTGDSFHIHEISKSVAPEREKNKLIQHCDENPYSVSTRGKLVRIKYHQLPTLWNWVSASFPLLWNGDNRIATSLIVVRIEQGDVKCLAHYLAHTTGRYLQGMTTIILEGNIPGWKSWHEISPIWVHIKNYHGSKASESVFATKKWKW